MTWKKITTESELDLSEYAHAIIPETCDRCGKPWSIFYPPDKYHDQFPPIGLYDSSLCGVDTMTATCADRNCDQRKQYHILATDDNVSAAMYDLDALKPHQRQELYNKLKDKFDRLNHEYRIQSWLNFSKRISSNSIKISIRRVPDYKQREFHNKLNKDPRVLNYDADFLTAPEHIDEEFLYKPTSDEKYMHLDRDEDEGYFEIALSPGWCHEDLEQFHSFNAFNRDDVDWYLYYTKPCLCDECQEAHNKHEYCYGGNCEVIKHSQESHAKDNHDLCFPDICEEVAEAHESGKHDLCNTETCRMKRWFNLR